MSTVSSHQSIIPFRLIFMLRLNVFFFLIILEFCRLNLLLRKVKLTHRFRVSLSSVCLSVQCDNKYLVVHISDVKNSVCGLFVDTFHFTFCFVWIYWHLDIIHTQEQHYYYIIIFFYFFKISAKLFRATSHSRITDTTDQKHLLIMWES